MAEVSKATILGYLETTDESVLNQISNILDSFFHKTEGKIVKTITDVNDKLTITFSDDTTKTVYNSEFLDTLITELNTNAVSGWIFVKTKAELLALTGDITKGYYVLKDDLEISNNGVWGFDGTSFYKGDDIVDQKVDANNTTRGVSGFGVAKALIDKPNLIQSKNIFDINNHKPSHYVKWNTGVHTFNEDFIIVTVEGLKPNKDYIFSNQGENNPSGVSNLQQMAFKNASDGWVSGHAGGVNSVTINTGADIVKAEFTIAVNRLGYQYQLNEGTERGGFIPFSKTLSNQYLNPNLQKMLAPFFKVVKTFHPTDLSYEYQNLRTALESCTDESVQYEVWIYVDVANCLLDYFTSAEIFNPLFKGLNIPHNVVLVNKTGNFYCHIHAELDLATYDETTRERVSGLNFIYSGGFKGILPTGKNIRYAVHDDIGSDKVNAWRLYEDCAANKIGKEGYTQAIGAGTRSGMVMTLRRVKAYTDDEGAAFSCHNNVNFAKPSKIIIEDCDFESKEGYNSIAFGSVGSGQNDEIIVRGSTINNGIRLYEESPGAGIDWKLSGGGNSKVPVYIEHTTPNQYTYHFLDDVEELRNRNGTTQLRGEAVYLNYSGSGGCFRFSNSVTVSNLVYGIRFEDTPAGELGKVKRFVSGNYLAISDTNLVGTAINDKIGIINGELAIVNSDDFIGIVVLNNFIRIK
ncbi:MAG: hypothetical protein V3V28_08600 [Polaribacter sp.]|uniref:hypothetical protein n=1 Tax=Polaribacter sp. TaxID=1920175 RepID=UPI002F359477